LNVRELIKQYAKEHGYTGLVGDECGCDIDDDLCPCDSGNLTECEFGYVNECHICADRDTCEAWEGDHDIIYLPVRCFVPVVEAGEKG